MTRRERLERKVELRREWADKRTAKADAAFSQAKQMASVIPFGQPILVGHHSEKRDRNYRGRIDGKFSAAFESSAMAEHHEQKADGLERQLDNSIFSDDENAVEAIQAKIEDLEAKREKNNAINKILRAKPKYASSADKLAQLAAIGIEGADASAVFTPDYCGRLGIPSYVNQNLGGNIGRLRKRIEYITACNARKEKAAEASNGVLIEGQEYLRVTFDEKPDREILNALRAADFRWGGGSWSGRRDNLPEAVKLLAEAVK